MQGKRWMAATLLVAAGTITAASGRAESLPYELTIDSKLDIKSPGQPKGNAMISQTRMRYALTTTEGAEELSIGSLQVKVDLEGRTLMNSRMDRAGATFQEGEQAASEIPFDTAPDPLKKMLAQFDVPAARMTLDAEGGELERKVLLEKDSSLVDNGVVENARLFHVRFPADQNEWESPAKLSMGTGHYARGTLKYVKAGTEPDGKVRVKVSGELKADGKLGDGEVRNGLYRIDGEQVYDPARKCWTSGILNVALSLEMLAAGQNAGTASGTMTIALAQPPTSPAAAAPATETPKDEKKP